jgi:hypothetical protein
MSPRLFAITAAFLALSSGAALAADAPKAPAYKPPHTAWGDPDFQGLWTNASLTRLERSPGVDKLNLTEPEAKAAETALLAWLAANDMPTPAAEGAPKAGDDPGGYNSFWIDNGSHLGRVNGEARTSWVMDPPTGKVPYRPDAIANMRASMGRQFGRFDNPETRSLGERCIVGFGSTSGPPMLNVLYNNNYQIAQSPGFVTIVVEMNHDARIVRLGGTHPPQSIRPWMGDSVGHWEGDTLVVETTNLNPGQKFTADVLHRLYLSTDATVVERFTRVAKDEILYEFTVDEPRTYTQAWKGQIPMHATKGPMYEYACHEGNYSLPGILRGARAEEARKAQTPAGGAP